MGAKAERWTVRRCPNCHGVKGAVGDGACAGLAMCRVADDHDFDVIAADAPNVLTAEEARLIVKAAKELLTEKELGVIESLADRLSAFAEGSTTDA